MKTDINGCSTTKAGQEQYGLFRQKGKNFIQYDYRNPAGELFSCVAKSLEAARDLRDLWIAERHRIWLFCTKNGKQPRLTLENCRARAKEKKCPLKNPEKCEDYVKALQQSEQSKCSTAQSK